MIELSSSLKLPENLGALVTTQTDGNLAVHTGDDPATVMLNRRKLQLQHTLPTVFWLTQTHSTDVVQWEELKSQQGSRIGDAIIASSPQASCAVLTADCLPILLWDDHGEQIGAVHAGWRGLLNGVVEKALSCFSDLSVVSAWIGPAISVSMYETSSQVRDLFLANHPKAAPFFKPSGKPEHWMADLSGIAEFRLNAAGVRQVKQSHLCTNLDARFYSYRRYPSCGRFATIIYRKY